jgi:cytochrome b
MQDSTPADRRLIWDLPTRVFHWALAASFAGAYLLSENDGARTFHVMFGYTVAGLVAFRLLWGFVGSTHSRFRDFAYSPLAAVRYLRDLAGGRARDYEGHNPAGSWAIYALLALAGATAVTGWLTYNEVGGEAFEEVHEVLANAWLVMVVVHVAGVIVGSLAHGRNLVATMITGRRSAVDEAAAPAMAPSTATASVRPGWVLGSALLATVLGFWTWSATTGGGLLLAGAEGGDGAHEHGGQDVGEGGDEGNDDGDEDEHEDDD